jgi:formylglycine-generating enzyme
VFNRAIADDLLEEMVKKPAIQILTAGRQQDQAQEREGHGVFTQVLVRGLAGDAFTGKDWVALEELGVWMKQRVFAESNRKQLPQFGNISGEGQFVFLRPGDQVAAAPPPAPAPVFPTIRVEPRQQFGTVAFVSQIEGIEVWLGDERIGETRAGTALLVEQLGAGRYRVKASKGGYKPWEREIQVAANRRSDVVIDIEPLRPDSSPTIKTDDGAEMVLVPAGEFWMGSDVDDERERPRHRVFLDRYYIDKHEMTNEQFKRFIDAKGYERQELWSPAGWQWRTSQHGGFDQTSAAVLPRFLTDSKWNGPSQPVVGVSWWEAEAFCRFVGKRLPTEAEWEKAARGTEGRRYPWGESYESGRANSDHTNLGRTVPVGSYPQGVSPYGAHDMAGNVSEWVADWYSKEYYRRSPERNPKGPVGGETRVIRGGSWDNKSKDLRSTLRHDDTPSERGRRIGFRCAKDGEP